ncbi:hypothetical protein [Natronorubrum texcoconense]|uniref:Lipoprotein n=1 Tax=Natronorubrum texcoconense TaxID=1095776 RepID=A0A1G8TA35_9EURY|nr:hypothetical protein [Natronorubrum texcoconense]SDJ37530.1 hypothetical protein SAMN04515672_0355 [Natronorubrum texcoconense]
MERRKILLGSGAALATALAGCSGSETSDGSDDDDDGSDPDPNGNDKENGDDNGDHDTDGTNTDDVPGFDGKKLDVDSDAISVKAIDKKGDKLEVLVETDITDHEKLYAELKSLADDHDDAIVDIEAFIAEIKTVEWIIEHSGTTVASFYVNVDWIVSYLQNELSKDEFYDKVKQTAE